MPKILLLALAVAAGACASRKPAPPPPANPSSTKPPTLRLPNVARPVQYAVDLTIAPDSSEFHGSVDIELDFTEKTTVLWLNGTELAVDEARLSVGDRPVAVEVIAGGSDFVGFELAEPVGPARARLHVAYRGKTNRRDSHGIFHEQEEGRWYAFTQFEAIDARRAFPCFDEPSYKTPWRLTLHVPKTDVAVANTPIASERDEAGGLRAVAFQPTRPLPSYLVAFAVGPFDLVDAGKAGKNQTPIRIVVPKGRGGDAKWAAETTPQILGQLEDYFGSPYPYEKLDLVDIPLTTGFGAMENAGMVTFAQSELLGTPGDDAVSRRRTFASTCAHELAHMWFGDLVTAAWWDDIWLNEAFATWMETKIIERWKPDWYRGTGNVETRLGAMAQDALTSARRVREPIASDDDIADAFDGITYDKGASLLAMFESWVGEAKFRRGIQKYLAQHAWKNATAADFLAAVSAEAGQDLAAPFSSFLDQVGVPLVTVELSCAKGEPPKLALSQTRYLPRGSGEAEAERWTIPMCIASGLGKTRARACGWLAEPTMEAPLSAKKCPDWVLPNTDGIGYYHLAYHGDLLHRLLDDGGKRLTLPERLAVLGDALELARGGHLPYDEALGFVPAMARDPSRQVLEMTVGAVGDLEDHLLPDELRGNYARLVQKLYGARARQLGWKPRPGESDDAQLLRPPLVGLVADEGQDKRLGAEATALANGWLDGHERIDASVLDLVLQQAAAHGDRALFDKLHGQARSETNRRRRAQLLGALGAFRDPALVQAALALVLTDEFAPGEASRLLFGVTHWQPNVPLAYAFVKAHFDELAARLPREAVPRLPHIGAALCDDEHHAEVEQFFRGRSTKFPGGPRELEQALEEMSLCAAQKKAEQPQVAAFLKKY